MTRAWELEAVRAVASALRSGQLETPVSEFALARVLPRGASAEMVGALKRWSTAGVSAEVQADFLATLAEAQRASAVPPVELVWTGPEGEGSSSRDTSAVVRQLFLEAKRSVLVAGFAFAEGRAVFEALAQRMDESAALEVQFFVNIARSGPRDVRAPEAIAAEWSRAFRERQWPGERPPVAFYDPRALKPDKADRASLHAKCVVIDATSALVTSANFTGHAQHRNIELGLKVTDPALAGDIVAQFESLVARGQLLRVPGL